MPRKKNLPAHYRNRADELRQIAAVTVDATYRDILQQCADDYDNMANQAEMMQVLSAELRHQAQASSTRVPIMKPAPNRP